MAEIKSPCRWMWPGECLLYNKFIIHVYMVDARILTIHPREEND